MKKKKIILSSWLMIIGLSLILFPIISSNISRHKQKKIIDNYTETINIISDKKYKELMTAAEEYNEKIYVMQKGNNIQEIDSYKDQLSINNNNIMAYINIPKIGEKLPIYHGTSKEVLQIGVGHLMSSSMPIGGINTRSVLFGHRGLPNSELFTRITRLKTNDIFTINVLNEKLYYKIINTKTILPRDLMKEVKIEEGKDLVTLVTCTPYGVNSHRLLITGERVKEPTKEIIYQEKHARSTNKFVIFTFIIAAILVLLLIILKRVNKKIKKERRKKDDKEYTLYIKSIIIFITSIIFL
jgi:sortase A